MTRPSQPRLPLWAKFCLFWTLFIGVGAVVGAAMMWFWHAPMNMDPMLSEVQKLPVLGPRFHSFVWPGVFLFVVNGVTQLVAAWLIWTRHRLAAAATLACAIILMAWLCLQWFVVFGPNYMTNLYGVFALAEGAMAVLWMRGSRPNVDA